MANRNRIMWGANTVVCWHKLSKVENESTLRNSIVSAICVPSYQLVEIWRNSDKNSFVKVFDTVHIPTPRLNKKRVTFIFWITL